MSLFRLYIDEVGNHDLTHAENLNERFLSLTGVIVESQYCIDELIPSMEQLKRHFFCKDPDVPIIFHRKDIVNKRYPFQALRNPEIEAEFNQTLLNRLMSWNYRVITVVIDKYAHKEKYTKWQFHPYHYCLSVMLERYVLFLHYGNNTGDVMVESRGGVEDRKLKESFERLYRNGNENISREIWQAHLTSSKLKVCQKKANICGLQLADLIAHPSRREILLDNHLINDERDIFGDKITQILRESKYHRNYKTGEVERYGKKLLP